MRTSTVFSPLISAFRHIAVEKDRVGTGLQRHHALQDRPPALASRPLTGQWTGVNKTHVLLRNYCRTLSNFPPLLFSGPVLPD